MVCALKVADRMKPPANGTVKVWDAGKASVISQGIAFTKKGAFRRKRGRESFNLSWYSAKA